jgi:Raf kinase inhibitor-like YbhB/YbcL family protein
MSQFQLTVDGIDDGGVIPGRFAFCVPAAAGNVAMAPNRNPGVSWTGVPDGTRSLALFVVDASAPTVGDDVNVEGRMVPADLPRGEFSHWVVVDIPADLDSIGEGASSDGVTPHGKHPAAQAFGVEGINDYTGWFAGDPEMEGVYGGYDGPCPPWNDSIVHHYTFYLYALDVETVDLSGAFTLADARAGIDGHVLASDQITGSYTLTPSLLADG